MKMNIFNRIVPWFIPTKTDQVKWYREELLDNPKEVNNLTREFSEISKIYNERLGDFESVLAKDYQLYEAYIEVKSLAQQTNFLWNRIQQKIERSQKLQEMLRDLK